MRKYDLALLLATLSCPLTIAAQPTSAAASDTPPVALQGIGHATLIDLGVLKGADLSVQVNAPGAQQGDAIQLRWRGSRQGWVSTWQPANGPSPIDFTVPHSVIKAEAGMNAVLSAHIKTLANHEYPLPALRVAIAPALGGQQVAERLNARFLDTRDVCDEGRPAYYCDGLMLRSIGDGDFFPWNPSERADRLGMVSFSWLRRGTRVTSLHGSSGIVFLPQQEAIDQGYAMRYLCVYAYDAWTASEGRPDQGCGIQPGAMTAEADLSSCQGQHASTIESWYAFTAKLSHPKFQCSLSTHDAEQFAVAYKVRDQRPVNMPNTHNEVLLEAWPQNIPRQLPMEAFFYTNNNGRVAAMNFQRKYKQATNAWLPVIKLDLSKLPSPAPLSYSTTDQAVLP